ncbi:MAG TPA: hypothetical protein VMY35_06775, partial [Phycisphaerae bacterium]|nr:hypothetical protein [Phycisphaerae bacterium]
ADEALARTNRGDDEYERVTKKGRKFWVAGTQDYTTGDQGGRLRVVRTRVPQSTPSRDRLTATEEVAHAALDVLRRYSPDAKRLLTALLQRTAPGRKAGQDPEETLAKWAAEEYWFPGSTPIGAKLADHLARAIESRHAEIPDNAIDLFARAGAGAERAADMVIARVKAARSLRDALPRAQRDLIDLLTRAALPPADRERLTKSVQAAKTLKKLGAVAARIDLALGNLGPAVDSFDLSTAALNRLRKTYRGTAEAEAGEFRRGALAKLASEADLVGFINANLPVSERGKLLATLKNLRPAGTVGGERDLAAARVLVGIVAAVYQKKMAIEDLRKAVRRADKSRLRPEFQAKVDSIIEDLETKGISTRTVNRWEDVLAHAEAHPEKIEPSAGGEANPLYNPGFEHVVALARKGLAAAQGKPATDLTADHIEAITTALVHQIAQNNRKNVILYARHRTEIAELDKTAADEVRTQGDVRYGATFPQQHREPGWFKQTFGYAQLKPEQMTLFLGPREGAVAHDVLFTQVWEGTRSEARVVADAQKWLQPFLAERGLDTEKARQQFSSLLARQAGRRQRKKVRWQKVSLPTATYADGAAVRSLELDEDTIADFLATMDDPHARFHATKRRGKGITFAWARYDRPIKITDDDVVAVQQQFPELLAWVQRVKAWMAGPGYQLMNETYREINWFDMPYNANYWPLTRNMVGEDGEDLDPFEYVSLARLHNMGIVKERTGGSQPMTIGSFLGKFAKHVGNVGRYHGLALPIINARRMLNMPRFAKAVSEVKGGVYLRMMDEYLHEVAGTSQRKRPGGLAQAVRWLRGKAYRSTLGINPFVMAKQVASYPLIAAEVDARHVAAGLPSALRAMVGARLGGLTKVYDEMMEHAPLIRRRFTGDGTRILGPGGDARPLESFLGGHRVDWAMEGISMLDRAALIGIWQAVKSELADTRPDLTADTLPWWGALARRTEQLVSRTQPAFDTVDQSGWAREAKTSALTALMTMYSSQRNQNVNIVAREWWRLQNALREIDAPAVAQAAPP